MRKVLFVLASILFVLALPPALAFSNFRWFALEPTNYLRAQERHSVGTSTGLSVSELAAVDRGLVRYFQSDRDGLQLSLQQEGVVRSPFSERDAAHLLDVHDLVTAVLRIQLFAALFGIVFMVVSLVTGRWRLALKSIVAGSFLTIGLLGLLGILSLLDWDSLFLQFHFVSFSNDLWRLDPARDALIRLYPPNFFLDSTIQLVLMSVAEAVGLSVLGILLLRRKPRESRA